MQRHNSLSIALLAAGLVLGTGAAHAADTAVPWVVPDIEKLPNDKYGKLVRLGHDLVMQTHKYVGPEVADPAKRYAGNNLACASCHIDGGIRKFGNGFVGTFASYPQYRGREDDIQNIEDRINGCMERSMAGKALPVDGPEMRAMSAYLKFMSTGVPVGAQVEGAGLPRIAFIDRAADPARGKAVYAQFCASCHGAEGQGVRAGVAGDAKGYAFPPLWGEDSYNNGAGMARTIMAARFIKYNMPKGVTHDAPLLDDEQAFDVAAYINSFGRPVKANLEADFPNRKNKVVDAAFPPYRAGFTAEQHTYGPYKPIVEARERELKATAPK